MESAFASIAFVVCRESVEALLVLGILNAWLGRNLDAVAAARGRRFLWLGAVSGVAAAVALAVALLGFESLLPDEGQDYFQAVTVLLAAALILQMVVWMRRHGAELKRHLEAQAHRSTAAGGWWGVFALALVAVAREGSETVVFLYGILAGSGTAPSATVPAILSGFAVAGLLYWLLQLGGRLLSWRLFFRATELMLLLLAAALVMAGADALVSLGLLPVLGGALWDSSWLLDDGSSVGGLVASLTGYRARPDLISLAVYGLYWTIVLGLLARTAPRPIAAAR
jgi:high-affinity iron transporter